jgi:phosphocarrier protein FPr
MSDAQMALANGADGSGLVRTEVLFAAHAEPPSVADQMQTLARVAEALDGRPLTVRTWDVGGDKTVPFLPLPREANPFLGRRGLRAFLGPDAPLPQHLLVDQLTAVCRIADHASIAVMFPMITHPAEVEAAWELLQNAVSSDLRCDVAVGIMIETPAAALSVSTLAAGMSFVSVGTNDLAAYTAAVDRNSPVTDLADPLTPAVLRLVDLVVRERPAGVTVSVCGDLASRPEAVPLLLGLGIQELSCAPPTVPEVKAAVRRTDLAEARALAAAALQAPDADGVRALLDS